MSDFIIKKVKLLSDNRLQISYDDLNNNEYSCKFSELAKQELYDSIKGLSGLVISILDLKNFKDVSKRLTPIGVDFRRYNDGSRGAVITCSLFLPTSGQSAEISTPLLADDGKKAKIYVKSDVMTNIFSIIDYIDDYINGKRAQGNLFDKDDDDDKQAAKQPPVGATVMDPAAAAKAVEAVANNVVPMAAR